MARNKQAHNEQTEQLWTRPFVQLTVAVFFLFTSFYWLLPTLPIYIQQLGGTHAQVGSIVGVFTLTAVLLRPFVGALLDRYGRRAFMVWGIAFFALALYLYGWVGSVAALFALRVLHGASWAFSTTAAGTAITDVIPVPRRGEGMGWYGMAMTVAMAIGPMLGTWVLARYTSSGLFVSAAIIAAVALLLSATTTSSYKPVPTKGSMTLYDKAVLPIMTAIVFLTVAYGGVSTFVPLFAESLHVNPGAFFLVYAATLAFTRPLAGTLSDRRGEAFIIVPATAIVVVALVVLSMANGTAGVLAAAVLYGVGFGAAQPALQAATLRLVRSDRIGVANASFLTAFDLGIGIGSIALGLVAQKMGYRALFITSGASVVVSIVVFTTYVKSRLTKPASATPSSP